MKKESLCFISFILAFVGLVYEFVFAQTLTIVFGNTHLQYAITIGFFTFGLGLGALTFEFLKSKFHSPQNVFVKIQMVLIPTCALGLFTILYSGVTWGLTIGTYLLSYSPILIIAFLTGFELPLIMEMAPDEAASIEVLSYDFAGMFLATVLFPFVLLPELGIFATLNLCLMINLISLIYVSFPTITKFVKIYSAVVATVILLGFIMNQKIIEYFGYLLTT